MLFYCKTSMGKLNSFFKPVIANVLSGFFLVAFLFETSFGYHMISGHVDVISAGLCVK